MKTLIILILALASISIVLSKPYNTEHRRQYTYRSQSSQAVPQKICCTGRITLSPWALTHIEDVRKVADIMRQEYYIISQGQSSSYTKYIYPVYGGKSQEEMHSYCQQHLQRIVDDVQAAKISYTLISQANFFEQEAAKMLESLESTEDFQQQQQNIFEGSFSGGDISSFDSHAAGSQTIGGMMRPATTNVETVNKYDGVTHISYPTEIRNVDGRTYVVKKNCTTMTTTNGGTVPAVFGSGGLSSNSLVVNRTQVIPGPVYIGSGQNYYGEENTNINTNSNIRPIYVGGGSTTTLNQNIQHLLNEDGHVPNYSPTTTLDESFMENINRHPFPQPQVVIPVPGYTMSTTDIHGFNQNNVGSQVLYPQPGHHKVTITKYNKTIITGPDGRPIVGGSEMHQQFDDGQLVYNFYKPFGTNITMQETFSEEGWKKDERERLFWIFQQNSINREELERWQREQEIRLHDLASRWNTTVESIEEWQRRELDRYLLLNQQQNSMSYDLKEWQQKERARINWLLEQNKLTQEELDIWQRQNQQRLYNLARQYRISIEELEEWQKKELDRLKFTFTQHNSELDEIRQWQNQEQIRLNNVITQHNLTVEQLQESIRRDQDRLQSLSQQYHVNVTEMEKWLKNELQRLSGIIYQQQEEIKRLTDWQQAERIRLEMIVRQHNLTVEELHENLRHDQNYIRNLAQKYHVTIEELEEWQKKEIKRLEDVGRITFEKELKEWQQKERDRLMVIVQQNDLTIEEFERKIKEDRNRLHQLAQQYQIQVEEIEEWIKNEGKRLQSEGLIKDMEEQLKEWQINERQRLLMIVQQNELTIEELEKRLKDDQNRLVGLANTYQIQVKDIEEWMKKELVNLQNQGLIKVEDLKEWQRIERERLQQLVKQNDLTIDEFEKRIQADRNRLQQIAMQYHIDVTEIEEFIKNETNRVIQQGWVTVTEENLTEWQRNERDRLLTLVRQSTLTIEDLEKRLKEDHQRLYNLARDYHIRVEEIENWMRKEFTRLQTAGLVKELTDWQKIERARLLQMIEQNEITIEEFKQKIHEDRNRLQQLAWQYHITIEEIEEFITKEIERLKDEGVITSTEEKLTEWQIRERDHWLQIVTGNKMTIDEFEQLLKNDRYRLEKLAWEYSVSVEEIEEWIRKLGDRFIKMDLIARDEIITEWQKNERDYILQLLQLHSYSIEELERKLKEDRERLRIVALQHKITIEQLENWYKKEIQRLVQQNKLVSEHLTEWQKQEKDRLYQIVLQQKLTIDQLEKQLWRNREMLQQLANQYRITVDQLIEWHRKEVERLNNIGLVHNLTQGELTDWQKEEQKRLLSIATQVVISITEFEEFLRYDHQFQDELRKKYHITSEQLHEWQLKVLQDLQVQGKLDRTVLIRLEDWQKRERDRLYMLIQSQNLTIRGLEEWQKEVGLLERIANDYRIKVEDLKNWQRKELQRLYTLAYNYKMTINELEEFRRQELYRLQMIAHKSSLQRRVYEEWWQNEKERFDRLARKYGLALYALENYRRRLFLLCQGYLGMDAIQETQTGGAVLNSTTGSTGHRNYTFSKDRGDQPPKVYPADYEDFEPGLHGDREPTTAYPFPSVPTTRPYTAPLAPLQNIPSGGHTEYGRTYRRKEITYTVPGAVVIGGNHGIMQAPGGSFAAASASSSPSSGSYSHATAFGRGSDHHNDYQDDLGQQQQEQIFGDLEVGDLKLESSGDRQFVQKQNIEDFGQRTQKENLEDLTYNQQIVQKENLEDLRVLGLQVQKENSQRISAQQAQKKNLEDLTYGQQIVQKENLEDLRALGQQVQKENAERISTQQVEKENLEDLTVYGQQVVQKENLEDFGQQQVAVNGHHGVEFSNQRSALTSNHSASASDKKEGVIVTGEAVEEDGLWNKFKKKTKTIFG